uniref:Uncharacterized protein C9orf50 homolog isoform X2 n=1 Tax=Phascolarctos cinereus TaxID=38626 RepID=A0A6P5JDL3_PHACI|nr:uncharacterized protein C9orf50 homolog isoform X2 [Phascolarctos cinereus]
MNLNLPLRATGEESVWSAQSREDAPCPSEVPGLEGPPHRIFSGPHLEGPEGWREMNTVQGETRPKVSREPTKKASRKHLQHSTSIHSIRDSSSDCSCDSPRCSFCSDHPDLWNLVKTVLLNHLPMSSLNANASTSTMAKNSKVSKNRQTVKLKPALITRCSDDASGPQKRFHPFRVRFADESPKDMALRYWERNYEFQRSLLKSPTSCKSPEQISGKLGIWMEKAPRSGSQQTNTWRDEFLCAGRLDTLPMSFQELSADNLKKNSTYSSLHTSPLASLDFCGTRPFQDQATDPPKKNSTCSSLHTNTSSTIDFSGSRPFQDLPTDSPKKSSTFSNLYGSTLANIDFSSPRLFQDLSIDPAKHTSKFTSPVISTDRPRSQTVNTGASSVSENSPSLWASRMDTFIPHMMLLTSRKGGQAGAYQFFPPLIPLRTQSTNQGSSEPPR